MIHRALLALALATLAYPASSVAGESADALALVKKHLATLKAEPAEVKVIGDEVAKLFPKLHFVSVRFPLWPVARVPPEPLKAQNLFVVDKDKNLKHLTSSKELEPFFKGQEAAKEPGLVGFAYGRLTQEFVQDGFFKFKMDKESIEQLNVDGRVVTLVGKVEVVPEMGNMGEIKFNMGLDKAGKVASISEVAKVIAGVRPRCQATYLLHPDPVIRAICEQDLMVMGRAAERYLMEQRAKASPELQREIDRVWRRILSER